MINFPSELSYHQTPDTVTQTAKLDSYFPKLSLQQCVAGINKTLVALVLWGMGGKGGLLDTVMSVLKQWTYCSQYTSGLKGVNNVTIDTFISCFWYSFIDQI